MADQSKLPSETQMTAFASKLKGFRDTLDADDQHILDAMVAAAFKHEEKEEVQGYWWVATGPAYYPGWYARPVVYGTPFAYSYPYGYPVWYP